MEKPKDIIKRINGRLTIILHVLDCAKCFCDWCGSNHMLACVSKL
jgi:hypothetical protein